MVARHLLLILSILPFTLTGQNKFVGEYIQIIEYKDTMNVPEYLYTKSLILKPDSTFLFYIEENPEAFIVGYRETLFGSWTSNKDTITFFNYKFKKAGGIKFNYLENQIETGIKIAVFGPDGRPLEITGCHVDSLIPEFIGYRRKYDNYNKNIVTVTNKTYATVHILPIRHCIDFLRCEIPININKVKQGTLIEVFVNSNALETEFSEKKYILKNRMLYESGYFDPKYPRDRTFLKTK